MEQQSKQQVEQVSLEFIVDNAHETFVKTILSTRTKVLLIGGFVDEASAIKAYLAKTKPHID